MVAPIIWAGVALAGIYGAGWTAKNGAEAFEQANGLTKTIFIGGAAYASFKALQASGVLK